jgi:hypothetical protein
MSTGPVIRPGNPPEPAPLHPLLDGLLDDAGACPPGGLSVASAVEAHLRHRSSPAAALLGRFLCPVSRVPELVAALDGRVEGPDHLTVGLLVDTADGADLSAAIEAIEDEPRLLLSLVNATLAPGVADPAAAARQLVARLPDVEGYIEIPRAPGWQRALVVVADSAYGAMLSVGGGAPTSVPSEEDLAASIGMCVADEIPFACGTDLRFVVRGEESGVEHHGFLNVLLATLATTQGASLEDVARLLGERDGPALARRFASVDETSSVVTRSFFLGCAVTRFDAAAAELAALGVLPNGTE